MYLGTKPDPPVSVDGKSPVAIFRLNPISSGKEKASVPAPFDIFSIELDPIDEAAAASVVLAPMVKKVGRSAAACRERYERRLKYEQTLVSLVSALSLPSAPGASETSESAVALLALSSSPRKRMRSTQDESLATLAEEIALYRSMATPSPGSLIRLEDGVVHKVIGISIEPVPRGLDTPWFKLSGCVQPTTLAPSKGGSRWEPAERGAVPATRCFRDILDVTCRARE